MSNAWGPEDLERQQWLSGVKPLGNGSSCPPEAGKTLLLSAFSFHEQWYHLAAVRCISWECPCTSLVVVIKRDKKFCKKFKFASWKPLILKDKVFSGGGWELSTGSYFDPGWSWGRVRKAPGLPGRGSACTRPLALGTGTGLAAMPGVARCGQCIQRIWSDFLSELPHAVGGDALLIRLSFISLSRLTSWPEKGVEVDSSERWALDQKVR